MCQLLQPSRNVRGFIRRGCRIIKRSGIKRRVGCGVGAAYIDGHVSSQAPGSGLGNAKRNIQILVDKVKIRSDIEMYSMAVRYI
jgi:hypothetical protein